jgi:hypothetical protein
MGEEYVCVSVSSVVLGRIERQIDLTRSRSCLDLSVERYQSPLLTLSACPISLIYGPWGIKCDEEASRHVPGERYMKDIRYVPCMLEHDAETPD